MADFVAFLTSRSQMTFDILSPLIRVSIATGSFHRDPMLLARVAPALGPAQVLVQPFFSGDQKSRGTDEVLRPLWSSIPPPSNQMRSSYSFEICPASICGASVRGRLPSLVPLSHYFGLEHLPNEVARD